MKLAIFQLISTACILLSTGYNVLCTPHYQVISGTKAKIIMEKLPEFIANHLFLFSLLAAILSLLLWNMFSGSIGASQIVPAEATRLINHDNAEVLDLRSAEDFANGHIINAVNFPAANLEEQAKALEKYKDKPVILSCSQGQDSTRAARVLKAKGFEKIYCLKGGLGAWRNANLPLTKKDPKKDTKKDTQKNIEKNT